MDKFSKIWVISIITLIIISVSIVYIKYNEEEEIRMNLNEICVSKGYDEVISIYIIEFAGKEFIKCQKEVAIINDKGIAELEIIIDDIIFKGE